MAINPVRLKEVKVSPMGVEYKDYYSVLGVSRSATDKEIRTAYRKLAREHHPDVNQGVDERFKEINEAYEALKDPEKRRLYDSLGSNWRQGQNFNPPPGFDGWQSGNMGDMGGFSSFFDILFGAGAGGSGGGFSAQGFPGGGTAGFEDMFSGGGGRGHRAGGRGQHQAPEQLNIEQDFYLDLEEVASGVSKEVVTSTRKRLTVNIPKGVKPGTKIRLAGEGHAGQRSRGDLLLVVRYRKHPKFKLEEDTLIYEAPVPIPDLVLGGEIKVPTLQGGELSMTLPAGTQPGRMMRLKGQGLPSKDGKSSGDLLVRPKAVIPAHLTEREKTLYQELKALHHH
ncbi:DnaJ C-terminal domain-containing protein [Vampirovibrio sp.]|uniref:DnaJ C-terminal domain-containing protein n=1 Tax=Vampirovibrio sp. TaxID=2717857 RepID=UPI0035939579